jgi:hypothetical protein
MDCDSDEEDVKDAKLVVNQFELKYEEINLTSI